MEHSDPLRILGVTNPVESTLDQSGARRQGSAMRAAACLRAPPAGVLQVCALQAVGGSCASLEAMEPQLQPATAGVHGPPVQHHWRAHQSG